jgi:hypothetical protein
MTKGEEARFNLLGRKVLAMVARWQTSERQSQWHQVEEFLVFSLQIVWFSHDSFSPEILIAAK